MCVPTHRVKLFKFGALQVIMIRSLFSYVRILPAYRLYRACKVRYISGAYGVCQRKSPCKENPWQVLFVFNSMVLGPSD
jgi:hypothetical protein